MKLSISVLEKEINIQLDSLLKLKSTSEKEQSSLHFEHIADTKEAILELRRAIMVLKCFTMEDLMNRKQAGR